MAAIAISKLSEERRDIKVDIYEASSQFSEIGAGIALWLRSWKVLRKLGLDGSLAKLLEAPVIEHPPRKSDSEHRYGNFCS